MDMTKVVFVAITVTISPLSASADEVETECPLTHPERPGIRLISGECLPYGNVKYVHIPDEIVDEGSDVLTTIQIYRRNPRTEPLTQAKIECGYSDHSTVLVPIPGALLRCGHRGRRFDRGTPAFRIDYSRIWAVSETEGKPEPSK